VVALTLYIWQSLQPKKTMPSLIAGEDKTEADVLKRQSKVAELACMVLFVVPLRFRSWRNIGQSPLVAAEAPDKQIDRISRNATTPIRADLLCIFSLIATLLD
jgi:hypothetical protein